MKYGELIAACRAGVAFDASSHTGERRVVDARLLRRCCTEDAASVDPRGLDLRNAAIQGPLDLAGTVIAFPLRFDGCVFDTAPLLERAQLQMLAITGAASLPGLLGNGLQVHGDLDLSRSRIHGAHRTSASTTKRSAVWLCESRIDGRLLCLDTVIDTAGDRAIQADRMHVGGTVRLLHGFTTNAEVRMIGAQIDGSLDLTGAHIAGPAGLALDLGDARVDGSVFLIPHPATGRGPTIAGRIDLGSARIGGQLLVRDATIEGPSPVPVAGPYGPHRTSGTAVNAPRLTVGGDLTFQGACRIRGGFDLALSDLGSLTLYGGCQILAPGRTALDLTNAELRSSLTLTSGVVVEGTIRIPGLHLRGNLSMRGITIGRPEDGSLVSASGVTVDGDVELGGITATGGHIRFRNASINGAVDARGASLDNPAGRTLALHQCTIGGSVRLVDGFRSHGYVSLNRSTIEGRLDCQGGSFHCPGPSERNRAGHAVEAISVSAQGGLYLGWATVDPSVDFTNATAPILADDPDRWPSRFVVSGLTYDRFENPRDTGTPIAWDSRKRCAWLGRQVAYDAGPYEQLAKVFRQHGYAADAEAILIAQRHAARRTSKHRIGPLRRGLDAAYGWTVGYGFRPSRVLWLLLVLLLAVGGSLHLPAAQATMRATDERGNVYAADGRLVTVDVDERPGPGTPEDYTRRAGRTPRPDVCGEGQVRCFSPALYAIDTVVPLISLGQRSAWYANPHAAWGGVVEWWLNIATLVGWLLSTIFVLSFARLSRSS